MNMLQNKVFKLWKQKNLLPAVLGYVVIEFLNWGPKVQGTEPNAAKILCDFWPEFGMNEQIFCNG